MSDGLFGQDCRIANTNSYIIILILIHAGKAWAFKPQEVQEEKYEYPRVFNRYEYIIQANMPEQARDKETALGLSVHGWISMRSDKCFVLARP